MDGLNIPDANDSYWGGGDFDTQGSQVSDGYSTEALSAITTTASTLMNLAAKKSEMDFKNKQVIGAMKGEAAEYEFMASVADQQMEEVDRMVGDKMTAVGLKRLKDTARLKAAAAMSGTAGGSTNSVINEAAMIEQMDKAVLVAMGRQQKRAIGRKLEARRISTDNRLINLENGIMSPMGAGLSMIDAGLQGFQKGYQMLPRSERRKYFGYQEK